MISLSSFACINAHICSRTLSDEVDRKGKNHYPSVQVKQQSYRQDKGCPMITSTVTSRYFKRVFCSWPKGIHNLIDCI